MDYGIEVKAIAPQPVAAVRERVAREALGDFFGRILPEVEAFLESAGAEVSGPSFGRFHEYGEDEVDAEAGFPVLEPIEGGERVAARELPGGRVVAGVHEGPYDSLSETHDAVRAYCDEGSYEIIGAPWEVYWCGPGDSSDSADWRTEVVYPVA